LTLHLVYRVQELRVLKAAGDARVREYVLCGREALRGCNIGVRVPSKVVVLVIFEDLVRFDGCWLLLRASLFLDVQGGRLLEFHR
jgi:hypothetical protein